MKSRPGANSVRNADSFSVNEECVFTAKKVETNTSTYISFSLLIEYPPEKIVDRIVMSVSLPFSLSSPASIPIAPVLKHSDCTREVNARPDVISIRSSLELDEESSAKLS